MLLSNEVLIYQLEKDFGLFSLLLDVYIKENETKVNEVYIKLEDNMLLVDACHAQT